MTPKENYHLIVIGNVPFKDMQEYRFKAELMLELVGAIEARELKTERPEDSDS